MLYIRCNPNRMESVYFDIFRGQVGRECKFALMAVNGMEKALVDYENLPLDLEARIPEMEKVIDKFWYSVEAFLMATGNISKVFWPSVSKSHKERAKIEKRCTQLREKWGIKNDSPLASRELRNHFEHFDERIDSWYYSKRQNLMDSNPCDDT